jgi:CspA family cold shock protein
MSTERFTGRVKWFNNKAGYGFITATDGPNSGTDIFVHHSSVNVQTQQYKYLVLGEYVEFALSSVSTGEHQFQAADVSGIKGGKLMCETRHEMQAARTNYKEQDAKPVQNQRPAKARAEPKAEPKTVEKEDDKDWTPSRKPRQQQTTGGGRGSGRGAGRGRGRGAGGRT